VIASIVNAGHAPSSFCLHEDVLMDTGAGGYHALASAAQRTHPTAPHTGVSVHKQQRSPILHTSLKLHIFLTAYQGLNTTCAAHLCAQAEAAKPAAVLLWWWCTTTAIKHAHAMQRAVSGIRGSTKHALSGSGAAPASSCG
jgi:hypothetical protein